MLCADSSPQNTDASSSLDFAGLFHSVMDAIGYVQTAISIVGVLA